MLLMCKSSLLFKGTKMVGYFREILCCALICFFSSGELKAGSEMRGPVYSILSSITGGSSIISPDNDTRINLFLLYQDTLNSAAPDFLAGRSAIQQYNSFALPFEMLPVFEKTQTSSDAVDTTDDYDKWYHVAQCQSIDAGDQDFLAALKKNTALEENERTQLIQSRQQLRLICEQGKKSTEIKWSIALQTTLALEFLTYLQASGHFYDENWLGASNTYKALLGSSDPWVNEASHYMFARSMINFGQDTAFDAWGDFAPNQVNKEAVKVAGEAFTEYLSRYPDGHYAKSALGLMRRVYWLEGDERKLVESYMAALPLTDNLKSLITEIDHKVILNDKFYQEGLRSPLLLATYLLFHMRQEGQHESSEKIKDVLNRNKALLSDIPNLYNFLLANYSLYVEGDAEKALKLVPEAKQKTTLTSLQFSMQALHGIALNKLNGGWALPSCSGMYDADTWTQCVGEFKWKSGDHYTGEWVDGLVEGQGTLTSANGDTYVGGFKEGKKTGKETFSLLSSFNSKTEERFWIGLLQHQLIRSQRGVIELWLGKYYERTNDLKKVFQKKSLIIESSIRRDLMLGQIDRKTLRDQIELKDRSKSERDFALFVLLVRDLSDRQYSDFLKDIKSIEKNANFDGKLWGISSTSEIPLAVFRRGKTSDEYTCPSNLTTTVDTLSKNPKDMAALLCLSEFYRLNDFISMPQIFNYGGMSKIYKEVIDNENTQDEVLAYALYRSIMCYKNEYYRCEGDYLVEKERRKRWFEQLKIDQKNSRWAKELKYYW